MRTTDRITITAAATWLPERRDNPTTVGSTVEKTGYIPLAVSNESAVLDMAVRAAGVALAHAGWSSDNLDLVQHAWADYQGHDYWSPAHYVAFQLGAHKTHCRSAFSRGATVAAAPHYKAPQRTCSPTLPSIALWLPRPTVSACHGLIDGAGIWGVYGGGASAVLLCSSDPDYVPEGLRLRLIISFAAPHPEEMNRGDNPFASAPRKHIQQMDAQDQEGLPARPRRHRVSGSGARTAATHRSRRGGGRRRGHRSALRGASPSAKRCAAVHLPPGPGRTDLHKTGGLRPEHGPSQSRGRACGLGDLIDNKLLEPGENALALGTGAGLQLVLCRGAALLPVLNRHPTSDRREHK